MTVVSFPLPVLPLDKDRVWCVYIHSQGDVVLWVGVCHTVDVLNCPDAKNNRAWFAHVHNKPNIMLTVEMIAVTELECNRARFRLIQMYRPIANRDYKPIVQPGRKKTGPVRCVETGQEFRNAADVAAFLGVTPAAISQHLSRPESFPKVQGFTFTREHERDNSEAVKSIQRARGDTE